MRSWHFHINNICRTIYILIVLLLWCVYCGCMKLTCPPSQTTGVDLPLRQQRKGHKGLSVRADAGTFITTRSKETRHSSYSLRHHWQSKTYRKGIYHWYAANLCSCHGKTAYVVLTYTGSHGYKELVVHFLRDPVSGDVSQRHNQPDIQEQRGVIAVRAPTGPFCGLSWVWLGLRTLTCT
jgi:hypothetical protein